MSGHLAVGLLLGVGLIQPAQAERVEFPIDYSVLPQSPDIPDSTRAEYFGRVYVLHCVLDSWKKGVTYQLPTIIPWLESDERIGKKWEKLTDKFDYHVISQADGERQVVLDTRDHLIRLNLKRGVYLDSDPAFVLVGAILDAEYFHAITAALFRADTPAGVLAAGNPRVVDEVLRQKRTSLWQMDWYRKALDKNPMVLRDEASEHLRLYLENPSAWKEHEIALLSARLGAQHSELIADAWDTSLPNWYDLPN